MSSRAGSLRANRGFLSLKEHLVLLFRECYSRSRRRPLSVGRGGAPTAVSSLSLCAPGDLRAAVCGHFNNNSWPVCLSRSSPPPTELFMPRTAKRMVIAARFTTFLAKRRIQLCFARILPAAFHNRLTMNCLLLYNALIYLSAWEMGYR